MQVGVAAESSDRRERPNDFTADSGSLRSIGKLRTSIVDFTRAPQNAKAPEHEKFEGLTSRRCSPRLDARAQADEKIVQLLERLAHPMDTPGGDGLVESFL